MGRKAGVSAEETRTELLAAAATIFAQKGYDGASIADICKEAGLSTGPVYLHYGSKAELFVAVLEAHGHEQFLSLMPGVSDVTEFLSIVGSTVDQRPPAAAALVIEAIVASGRDPEVATLVRSWLESGEELLASSLRDAQRNGIVDDAIDAATISRLATIIGLGSYLTGGLGVAAPDHDDWGRVITRIVDAFRTDD